MVWDLTGEPYVGSLAGFRIFGDEDPGQPAEQLYGLETNLDGRFSIGLHRFVQQTEGLGGSTIGDKAAVTIRLEPRHPHALPDQRQTFALDPSATHQDLGVIRVRRERRAVVRVLGVRNGAETPLLAGVGSVSGAVTTDRDGLARVSVGDAGWIDVFAPGFEFVRLSVPANAFLFIGSEVSDDQEPWTVRLRPAPALEIEMPTELMVEDPTLQPLLTLRYEAPPFGSFYGTGALHPELTTELYRAVFGVRHVQQRNVGKDFVKYFSAPTGVVSIQGLRPGSQVSLEWTDCLGAPFASTALVFTGEEEEVKYPQGIELAFLEAHLMDGTEASAPGGFAMLRGPNPQMFTRYFDTATLAVGPLHPGTLGLQVFSNAGARFEDRAFSLRPGLNEVEVQNDPD